jgi:hypothetical protein
LIILLVLTACGEDDFCIGRYQTCEFDEVCAIGPLPTGKCLDDGITGRSCAFYVQSCPTTHLQWAACAGREGMTSPWAGRCVRPEFLPDAGDLDGGIAQDAGADMSAASDDGGPS